MPPPLHPVHFDQALNYQAMPVLEAIASNENLRHLRRFERDDPPPYASSTESSEHDGADSIVLPRDRPIPEELQAILERPIDDDELVEISTRLASALHPERIYYSEAKREERRFEKSLPIGPTPPEFRTLNFSRRKGVIVRHNVKRRWEKLGVWNPEWGFAGRQLHPRDDYEKWAWWWQPAGTGEDFALLNEYVTELIARALRLRQKLRRGEHAHVVPRSHPQQHTTAAEAEAFLISRPWFIFRIEVAEEFLRQMRLLYEHNLRYPFSAHSQVIKWWKERGDWRDEFNEAGRATAWKWRHESPSPEPEDLAPLKQIKEDPLNAAAEMEFTPSEIDELETINLPRSEQPEGFWVAKKGDWLTPSFPGMMVDLRAEAAQSIKERQAYRGGSRDEGRIIRHPPAVEIFRKQFGNIPLFGPPPQAVNEEVSQPREDGAFSPPPKRGPKLGPKRGSTRGLRRCSQREEVGGGEQRDEPLPLPPRRSARIAGNKRPAEPLPLQTGPNKRSRGTAAPKPATLAAQPAPRETRRTGTRPGPKQPPAKEKTETGAKPGPGRPRKENGSNKQSAMRRKPAETPAPARTRNKRDTVKDTSDMPKRRGRPRKSK